MALRTRIAFSVPEAEAGSVDEMTALLGLDDESLSELSEICHGDIILQEGGGGRGAQGPGVTVILGLSDNLVSTVAGLIVVGETLRRLIRKVARRSQIPPMITEPTALSAVAAAASSDELRSEPGDLEFLGCRSMSGIPANGGSDERDIWCASFDNALQGYLFNIYVSPSGVVLARSRVPYRTYFDGRDWITRSDEDLARFSERWGNDTGRVD